MAQLLVSGGCNLLFLLECVCIGGADYVNDGSLTLVFNSSFTSLSIPLQVVDDSISEIFQASLSFPRSNNPEGVILSPDITNIRIHDYYNSE